MDTLPCVPSDHSNLLHQSFFLALKEKWLHPVGYNDLRTNRKPWHLIASYGCAMQMIETDSSCVVQMIEMDLFRADMMDFALSARQTTKKRSESTSCVAFHGKK